MNPDVTLIWFFVAAADSVLTIKSSFLRDTDRHRYIVQLFYNLPAALTSCSQRLRCGESSFHDNAMVLSLSSTNGECFLDAFPNTSHSSTSAKQEESNMVPMLLVFANCCKNSSGFEVRQRNGERVEFPKESR